MLEIKIGRKSTQQNNKVVESALTQFVELKAEQTKIDNKLKEQQTILAEFGKGELSNSDNSSLTLSVGDDGVNIKFDWNIKVSDKEKLREILGDRYQDLVTVKTEITPVAKLKKDALAALEKDDSELMDCFSIKEKAPAFKVV